MKYNQTPPPTHLLIQTEMVSIEDELKLERKIEQCENCDENGLCDDHAALKLDFLPAVNGRGCHSYFQSLSSSFVNEFTIRVHEKV